MSVLETIQKRSSVRNYADTPIDEAVLERVLEAGRLAPTASNQQQNKVVVVKDQTLREQLAEACCGQSFVAKAPVVLVVCVTNEVNMPCGQPARTVDASIALSFMVLEATEEGLGTCWLGAFNGDQVKEVLNIPAEYTVIAVTPLGYPARETKIREKKPMEEFVIKEKWLK